MSDETRRLEIDLQLFDKLALLQTFVNSILSLIWGVMGQSMDIIRKRTDPEVTEMTDYCRSIFRFDTD